MIVSNIQPVNSPKVENQPEESHSSSHGWTRQKWRKIVIGATCTTNVAALATLIYGVAVKDNLISYIGAGSGLLFSFTGLLAHLATYQCTDENSISSAESSDTEEKRVPSPV